jgi:hypothetical protein
MVTVLTVTRLLRGFIDGVAGGFALARMGSTRCTLLWGIGGIIREVYMDLRSLVASFFVFWNNVFGWLVVAPE